MFTRRLITVLGSLVIISTLLTGSAISAASEELTIEDLIKMTDKELADVPQDTIVDILQNLYESGEKEWSQYDEKDLQRIIDQYLSNERAITLETIPKLPPGSSRASSFDIGWSITVSWAEDGDKDTSGWGFYEADADYNVSSERGEAYVTVALLGSASAWARTGHSFNVGGSGHGYYRIDMDSEWICSSLMWGTNTLSLFFEEWVDGDYSSTKFEIDSYSSGIGGEYDESYEYSTPSYVRLEAGGTYRISLLVETQASTVGFAAGADCMTSYYGSIWDYLHLEYSP